MATGKQANIKGQVYFFDSEGKMLSGWVGAVNTGSDTTYQKLYVEGEREDSIRKGASIYADIYYCSGSEDGHAKRNRWVKTWKPEDMADEDEDNLKWFWFGKDGKLYRATDTGTIDTKYGVSYELIDGVYSGVTDSEGNSVDGVVSKKKVNSKDYWFDLDGQMVSSFYLLGTRVNDAGTNGADNDDDNIVDSTAKMYYFGDADDGSMKTGSQSIRDDAGDTYKFYFSSKAGTRGEGITGNQSGKLYYYGKLITAGDYKYQIARVVTNGATAQEVHYFIINNNGSIVTNNSQYKEDGDILIDARNVTKAGDARDGQKVAFVKSGTWKGSLDLDNCYASGATVHEADADYIRVLGDEIDSETAIFGRTAN